MSRYDSGQLQKVNTRDGNPFLVKGFFSEDSAAFFLSLPPSRSRYLNLPSLRKCENISPPGTNSRTMYKLLLSCKFGANFTFPPPRLFLGPRCNWLTLKWNSKLTKKGKLMACRILFSFSVCSTCFSLTTWEGQNRWLDGHRSSFRSLSHVDRRWMRGRGERTHFLFV